MVGYSVAIFNHAIHIAIVGKFERLTVHNARDLNTTFRQRIDRRRP